MPQIINSIFYFANRGGIPRIESTGVTVGASEVSYSFSSNVQFSRTYSGLVLVKLAQAIPSDTTTTLPVTFTSTYGGTKAVNGYGGAAVTVADIKGTGIYLAYYENGTVQLL